MLIRCQLVCQSALLFGFRNYYYGKPMLVKDVEYTLLLGDPSLICLKLLGLASPVL